MTNFLLLCYNKIHCLSLYSYQKIMDLKITIKNLGKLIDADIRINKFTVFAGANNTGKSFASIALYSRLSASMEDVDILGRLEDRTHLLRRVIDNLKVGEIEGDADWEHLFQAIDKFNKIVSEMKGVDQRGKIPAFEKNLHNFCETCQRIMVMGTILAGKIEAYYSKYNQKESEKNDYFAFKEYINSFKCLPKNSIRKIFTTDIEKMFEYNLLQNFQAKKLSELANDKGQGISVKIDAGSLMLKQEEYVKDYLNDEHYSSLNILDTFIADKVLYMGSPLFWQLKNPLESANYSFSPRERLSGVPKYFYDMVNALRVEYVGAPISSEVLDRLTGEHGINGKVSVAATGDMLYAEKDSVTVPLMRAATGITDLGMLALLIEKNILDKNTFLFIDEPEAHLHPAWQVEMADTLFKLAEAGVHVVIATHSSEILKWLEVHVRKDPKAKEIIALNHFFDGSAKSIDIDRFDTGLAEIKIKLTDPFAKLHWEGLRHAAAR